MGWIFLIVVIGCAFVSHLYDRKCERDIELKRLENASRRKPDENA